MLNSRLRQTTAASLIVACVAHFWPISVAMAQGQPEVSPSPSGSASPAPVKKVKKAALDPNACLTDPAAIEDMQKQKAELDERARLLAQRESELLEKQKALEEELGRLRAVRDDIDKSDVLKKKENEEKVAKLIETIDAMSPKVASQLLASVDENLAVTAMMQLPSAKLAKMMNVMDPAKASRLSEKLTGLNSTKGGEKEHANREISSTSAGGTSQPTSNAGASANRASAK